MPVVIAWLGELIVSQIGSWLIAALLSVGIGFVASSVASGVIDKSGIMSNFQSSGLWSWVSYLMIDKDITIVLSAWAGRAVRDSLKTHLTKLPAKSSGGGE